MPRTKGPPNIVRPYGPDENVADPHYRQAEALDHIATAISAIDHNIEALSAQSKAQTELLGRLVAAVAHKK